MSYCASAAKCETQERKKVLTKGSANFTLEMVFMFDSLLIQPHYHGTEIQVDPKHQ